VPKFVADEDVPRRVISALRASGLTIRSIREDAPGIPDAEVLELATNAKAVLITADKGFGERTARFHADFSGIVLLRLHGLNGHEQAALLTPHFLDHAEQFMGAFTVITPRQVRIRR